MAQRPAPGLPTREQVLAFIQSADQPAGKREIARAFGLHAQDKIALKALLKDMADEGLIDAAPGRAFHRMGGRPGVTVLRVADVDDGGNVWRCPTAGRRRRRRRASGCARGSAARWASASAFSPAPKRRGAAGSRIR